MLQRTGKWERERPEHNRGREREKAEGWGLRGYRKTACMGQGSEGSLEASGSGKVRQQFILLSDHRHSCWSLHILSWGTQLGFVLSLGT